MIKMKSFVLAVMLVPVSAGAFDSIEIKSTKNQTPVESKASNASASGLKNVRNDNSKTAYFKAEFHGAMGWDDRKIVRVDSYQLHKGWMKTFESIIAQLVSDANKGYWDYSLNAIDNKVNPMLEFYSELIQESNISEDEEELLAIIKSMMDGSSSLRKQISDFKMNGVKGYNLVNTHSITKNCLGCHSKYKFSE